MKKQFGVWKKGMVAVSCLALLGGTALNASANDTVSASVNALAGLSPVLSLTCTDVNFGVWRVPVRSAGGTTTVTLSVSANTSAGATTATSGGNTTGVAAASGYNVPNAAVCTVNGSNNPSQTIITAIANNAALTFGASNHNNLNNPSQVVSGMSADLALGGAGVAINTSGAGTFRVVGVLSIPETIAANNYGGYRTSTGGSGGEGNAATVTVTDTLLQ